MPVAVVSDAGTEAGALSAERPRQVWGYLAAGLGVLFLVGVRAAWFFTIDDAFITFRYSDNLAAGHGPVWNPGEDAVEGFTNFLWMLWHTPFAWLGLDLPTVAKLTSFAAGAAILVMLVRYGHQHRGLAAGSDRVVGGVPGRSDGLEWRCADFNSDGVHPSASGKQKVTEMLDDHFRTDVTAVPWFLAPGS